MKPTIWEGCYEDRWTGFIIPEAFAHPAKYSKALIERIYDHCLARGWLKKNDRVGDCFGGVATGGLIAAYRGLEWVGVELEPRFVGWGRQNIALHKSKLLHLACPLPRIVQGDSRRFHEIVAETCAIVTSPPYAQTAVEKSSDGVDMVKNWETYKASGGGSSFEAYKATQKKHCQGYGKTNGQIAALKSGPVDAVISSPPFGERTDGGKMAHTGDTSASNGGKQLGRSSLARSLSSSGQIEGLETGSVGAVITSPPYSDIATGAGGLNTKPATKPGQQAGRSAKAASQDTDQKYGQTEGQISRLNGGSVEAVVTSPPFEDRNACQDPKYRENRTNSGGPIHHEYGDAAGQIGKDSGETYWQAMAAVYKSCYLAIKPGGILVCVLKDYVKNKARVPLCDDTARLLEHCGFLVIERVHAMLVKETSHGDLFTGSTTSKTSRKSFFRRLAEAKGSPEINFEEVIFATRPGLPLA